MAPWDGFCTFDKVDVSRSSPAIGVRVLAPVTSAVAGWEVRKDECGV